MDEEPTKVDQSINKSLKMNNELECSTEFGISNSPVWTIPTIPFMSEELLLGKPFLLNRPGMQGWQKNLPYFTHSFR